MEESRLQKMSIEFISPSLNSKEISSLGFPPNYVEYDFLKKKPEMNVEGIISQKSMNILPKLKIKLLSYPLQNELVYRKNIRFGFIVSGNYSSDISNIKLVILLVNPKTKKMCFFLVC